jgi:hypothetical protein
VTASTWKYNTRHKDANLHIYLHITWHCKEKLFSDNEFWWLAEYQTALHQLKKLLSVEWYFWSVMDRSCEKWRSITRSRWNVVHTIKRRKANWIGHILRRNCLLKHVAEGELERRIEMTGRRGRRRKHLLDDLKEKRRYWILKEEALDRTQWRTRFERGYGPVVRQTAEWMNGQTRCTEEFSNTYNLVPLSQCKIASLGTRWTHAKSNLVNGT